VDGRVFTAYYYNTPGGTRLTAVRYIAGTSFRLGLARLTPNFMTLSSVDIEPKSRFGCVFQAFTGQMNDVKFGTQIP
jgi:hypothetical protein